MEIMAPFINVCIISSLSVVYISGKPETKRHYHCMIQYFCIYHESHQHRSIFRISYVFQISYSPTDNPTSLHCFHAMDIFKSTYDYILVIPLIYTTLLKAYFGVNNIYISTCRSVHSCLACIIGHDSKMCFQSIGLPGQLHHKAKSEKHPDSTAM